MAINVLIEKYPLQRSYLIDMLFYGQFPNRALE